MQTGRIAVVVAAAAALVVLAVGLAWLYSPASAPPQEVPAAPGARATPRSSDGAPARRADGATSEDAARSARDAGGGTTLPVGGADEGADGVGGDRLPKVQIGNRLPPAPHRSFASPEEAEAFVSARVVDLFAAVAPEVDPESIEQTCSPDGRDCTFEGPWPGDDFMGRWITAVGEGRTSLEAMQGVTFSSFEPVGEGAHRQFQIRAHVP